LAQERVNRNAAGYYQQFVTRDSGAYASSDYSIVVGIGLEVSAFWAKIGLFTSRRCAYRVEAKDRPQGQTMLLTLTKPFNRAINWRGAEETIPLRPCLFGEKPAWARDIPNHPPARRLTSPLINK